MTVLIQEFTKTPTDCGLAIIHCLDRAIIDFPNSINIHTALNFALFGVVFCCCLISSFTLLNWADF